MGVFSRRITGLFPVLALFLVVAVPGAARAQTAVSNPTTLVFTPSADHSATLTDGRPVVDHYDFNVYAVGASQPFQSTSIGKPAPASDGAIYYDFSGAVASWPLPGGSYEARVAAVGPNGSGLSGASNPFTFSSCAYTLSGTSASLPADGGGTQVTVTTTSGCSWTAVSGVSWVVLSTAGGTGSGTVVATVAANTTTSSRTGTLTVAGRTFTVNQAGRSCSYTLSASGVSLAAGGGSGSVGVTSTAGCSWTAASAASWVTVSPASGSGSGAVTYSAAANLGAARSATLTIAGNAFTVSQAGAPTGTVPTTPASPAPSSGATGVTRTPTLTWSCTGASSYTVRFGTTNPPPQVATGLAIPSYAPAALAAGSRYYWQVTASSSAGSTTGAVWSFTTTTSSSSSLPTPWVLADIGSVGLAGSASYSSGTFTVGGSGADIGGTADSFAFVDRPLTGLTQIVARVTAEQGAGTSAKAGVMMREGRDGLVGGASHVTLTVRASGAVEFITRSATGGATRLVASATQGLPVWLRLSRSGSRVTASTSTNGTTWRTVGSATLALTSRSLVGLAVTSRDTTQRNTTAFTNVTVR